MFVQCAVQCAASDLMLIINLEIDTIRLSEVAHGHNAQFEIHS